MTETNEKQPTPQELVLIELLADPFDERSKDEKSVAAKFAPKTVYSKLKQLHFQKALTARCDQRVDELKRSYRPRIFGVLAKRAAQERVLYDNNGKSYGIDAGDANRAAELVLKTTGDIGSGGHTTNIDVKQDAGGRGEETVEDAVRGISGSRFRRFIPEDAE